MCWFFFSCCVACGRTECLRPKNIQHGGVQRALALCSVGLWPQLIQSGFWFSLPLLPPSPSTSTVSIGNKSVVQVPPSSRMHVLFHSCWVAWYLRNEYLGFCLDNHMCVRLRQRLLRAPWTSWLQDWTSCHHNGTETGSSIRWRRGNCSGDVKALKHSCSERLHTCPTHQHTCGRAQSVVLPSALMKWGQNVHWMLWLPPIRKLTLVNTKPKYVKDEGNHLSSFLFLSLS